MFELSLNSQQSGFIPTSPYNNLGLSDYQDPVFAVNPANSSQLPVPFIDTVFQAINASEYILSGLSGNSQRDYIMGTAFGLYNQESANQILTAWARNNFTNTPHIELVFGQNFNGAYAKDNNTIYLSGEFLGANKDNIEAVTGVLVEEVGHYLDSQINVQDAAGDEGDIFSRLVRGQSISEGELLGLKNEDDTGIIFINNQPISIEQQNFYGGWWSDTFNGTNSNDVMYGNDGNDYIYGNGGNDYIYGGGNDDYLWGGNNNDYLWGENGADELRGDDGNDELRGGGNDDKLWGGNQDDKLWGEDGNDQLVGDSGNDEVNGGNGDDKVWGSGGDDKLWGERGNDQLTGDDGNDILNGYGFDNYERDTLSGGGGSDSFILSDSNNVYYSKNGSSDYALITDFNRYEDVIHLKQISLDASNSTQAWGYRLVTVGSNTEIRLNSGDTIAVLQGVSGLSLTGQGFVFEGAYELKRSLITNLYQDVLGRSPDAGGLQGWIDALGRNFTLPQIPNAFGHSEEAKGKVSGIYRDVLGREPDVGGLQGYLDALGRDWSLAQARFSIGHSEEAKGKISGIYRAVLGREPDVGGLQSYLDALGRDWSLAQVRSSIINSDVRLITFNNGQGKLTFTANDFVGTVDPNDFYRFTLNQRSNFNLTLDGLSEDANVELLNSSGGSITTSNYWGTTPDSITRTLDAGIYYIRVYQGRGAANTNYKLDVTADLNWAATDGILPPKSISLERTDSNGYGSPQKIDPTKPTWVVIHGWNGASNLGETMGLANALGLDGSQVLTLDWHELAKDPVNVGNAASWIQRVGTWAAKKLNDWGFTSSNINLAGHSLGSYVAYEIAKHTPGGVNRLVALDPAQEIPGGYITSQIKFKDNAKYSIAFYGSAAGSDPRGVTADATFSMGFGDGINPDKNHGRVTNLFANIVRLSRTDDRVRRFFGLENLNSNSYHPWVDNKFNDRGKYYGDAVVLPDPKDYLYEGRIEARFDGGNSFLKSLKYYDREHNKDEELFW
jgi:Ca2+-binding RTX toxin-like protein/pimeloyl-ACP methyl ester carboxylesterase